MRRFIYRRRKWLPWAYRILALGAALAVTVAPVPTTFDINATTEEIHMDKARGEPFPLWNLDNAKLFDGFDSDGRTFSGSFQVSGAVAVVFERVGYGPIRIRCQAMNQAGSVGLSLMSWTAVPSSVRGS